MADKYIDNAETPRRVVRQAVEKAAWLRQYHGASLLLEALLVLEGAPTDFAALVPHLSAPGRRKPTDGRRPNPTAPSPPSTAARSRSPRPSRSPSASLPPLVTLDPPTPVETP